MWTIDEGLELSDIHLLISFFRGPHDLESASYVVEGIRCLWLIIKIRVVNSDTVEEPVQL